MSKHHIQLNGNIYDTRTGKIVQKTTSDTASNSGVNRPSIDGFQRSRPTTSQPRPHQPQHTKKPLHKSQTLMRHAVQKPQKQAPDNSNNKAEKSLFDTKRLERAQKTPKSSLIQKFQNISSAASNPAQSPAQNPAPDKPAHQPNHTTQKSAPPSQPQQEKSLTEAALERADAHEQPDYHISKRAKLAQRLRSTPKSVTYSLVGLMAITVLGIGWYIALPNASVQLAANRSGVDANLPNYRPSGYQLDRSVEYEPGKVQLHYNTLTDNRSFSIKKEKTDWTSERLRQHVADHAETHQTVNSKGKTVFVYGNGNAMWIDGGIHYTIQGAYSLNSDQLIRLVESL